MKGRPQEIITTYGVDTTDLTPVEKKAMLDPASPEASAVFLKQLRAARKRLLQEPDYAAASAMLDKKVA